MDSLKIDEISDAISDGNGFPENIRLTENASFTHSSTTNACLDFYFEVMQNTGQDQIVSQLEKSWSEDALLTLKLIFQLRDVRSGKGAVVEFHHCLIWLFRNHPETLLYNLEFVAQHGYWKDLCWLIKFLLKDDVCTRTECQPRKRICETTRQTNINYSLEELISKRVNGDVSKHVWKRYLSKLPDDDAKRNALLKFKELSKAIHLTRSKEAKIRKKAAKSVAAVKLLNFKIVHQHFPALYDKVVSLFTSNLKRDKDMLDKNKCLPMTALVGKWAPTIGDSIDCCTSLGKNIARALYSSFCQRMADESELDFDTKAYVHYRKNFLTPLRIAIKVPERLMSQKTWSEIDYQRVSSVCMRRNKKNFLKNDAERFGCYLSDVKSGEKKIASGALLPQEIIKQFMESFGEPEELMEVGELQWKSYVENLKKSGLFKSALSICDVSGSMSGTPMEAAIALSLLTAELSNPPFKNHVCTFSSSPSLQIVNQATLKEKVSFVMNMEWGMNTNLQAVFDLILELAISTKLPPEEMVKTLFIFSDMEFDDCGGDKYETDFQLIKRKFEQEHYPLPAIVFWNLRGHGNRSKPVTKDEKNVALVSGFSGQMMKTFLESGQFDSPYLAMLKTLGNTYDHLKVID
ncbi:uncharacterized protein LOC130689883 [Daphnia carinata]|uniref:uncharacterized protein LOC130689883 n=1 Tax=Daphnia carinata TaxID=120202 RepID=UPI002580EFC6|nr:uncharacterized protein LOC130689883 [Daphnia carinata]XP_057368814.1 uncharacterized protein LOC130689883 [Daphnia carinata]